MLALVPLTAAAQDLLSTDSTPCVSATGAIRSIKTYEVAIRSSSTSSITLFDKNGQAMLPTVNGVPQTNPTVTIPARTGTSANDCSAFIDFSSDNRIDPAFTIINYPGSSTAEYTMRIYHALQYSYLLYSGAGTSATTCASQLGEVVNSFFCPNYGTSSGNADYFVDLQANVRVSTDQMWFTGGSAAHFVDEAYTGNDWIWPYHAETICEFTYCDNTGTYWTTHSPFLLMPVDGIVTIGQPLTKRVSQPFTLPSGGTYNWTEDWLTLAFAPGANLGISSQNFQATGLTFTASSAAQGWGGIRFNSGSGGTIASSIIERVRAYGGPAVLITSASPTILNTQIRDSPCCGVNGISVTGSAASPLLQGNIITRMSQGGVTVDNYAHPRLVRNVIQNNTGDGIAAGFQSAPFLAPDAPNGDRFGNDIIGNSVGVSATSSAYVNYSWYYYTSGFHNDGYNNVVSNRSNGNVATGSSAVAAGNSSSQRRNGFYFNAQGSSAGRDAVASGTGSRAYVTCNYWGPGSAPPFRTAATSGGVLYNTSYLAEDPRQNPFAPCLPIGGAARAAPTAQTSDTSRLTVLADAASMERPAEVLAALKDVLAAGGPLVAPALAEVGRLAMRRDAPPEATRILESYADGRAASARTAALAALVGVRGASGDGAGSLRAAEALVATGNPDAMLFGQTARVYLLTDAGRSGEAAEALAAVEALAPGSREGAMARSHLGFAAAEAMALDAAGHAPDGAARSAAPAAASRTAGGEEEIAPELAMGAARPNPTTGRAIVPLSLPEAAHVRLSLYDVLGREAAVLVDGRLDAGRHGVALQADGLAPGVYVLRAVVSADAGTVALTGRVTVAR